MKNKIFTAMMLALLAILAAAPAYSASMRTRLTLVIEDTPHSDELSHEVSSDLLNDDGMFTGSETQTRTFTDEQGRSVTETTTVFANVDGEVLMSADVAVTARSSDFAVEAGKAFAETVSVDVTIELFDGQYNEYMYALSVDGLPRWLNISGDILSSDSLDVGTTVYHHEVLLSGTSAAARSLAEVRFAATVHVSGDWPVMLAAGSKDVRISVVEKSEPEQEPESETPPEEPQDSSPDVGPSEPSDISPDVPVPESPDVEPESPEVIPKSPDVVPESPDIEPEESQDTKPHPPDVEPEPPDTGPDAPEPPPEERDYDSYLDTKDKETDAEAERPAVSLNEVIDNLTPEEIEAVRTLKVDGNVSDLSGLEAFTNLETLDLTEAHALETVDISGNKTIRTLNVSGNRSVRAINARDCSSLEILNCSNCLLEELNIEGCDSLNVLDCSNNRLAKLDAYIFRRLDSLRCFNQNITDWNLRREFSFAEYFVKVISAADEGGTFDSDVENITNIKAWDADGQELDVEYDDETGTAAFSRIPAKMTYDYITGFEDVLMDVTVFAAEYKDSDPGNPSCGGCNSGFAFSVSGMALALLLFRRKR